MTEIRSRPCRSRGSGPPRPRAGQRCAPRRCRSYARIVRENVFTFINNVLFGLGLTLVLLGRVSDALVSVGVVFANTLVSVVQEVRAKRTLERIALLTRPRATVVREGQERAVDPAEVVLGDLLRAGPGDQIVVDGPLLGPPGARIDVDGRPHRRVGPHPQDVGDLFRQLCGQRRCPLSGRAGGRPEHGLPDHRGRLCVAPLCSVRFTWRSA